MSVLDLLVRLPRDCVPLGLRYGVFEDLGPALGIFDDCADLFRGCVGFDCGGKVNESVT